MSVVDPTHPRCPHCGVRHPPESEYVTCQPRRSGIVIDMPLEELIERVMAEHWDFIACSCAFCQIARAHGLGPREGYPKRPHVSILRAVDNGVGYLGITFKDGKGQ